MLVLVFRSSSYLYIIACFSCAQVVRLAKSAANLTSPVLHVYSINNNIYHFILEEFWCLHLRASACICERAHSMLQACFKLECVMLIYCRSLYLFGGECLGVLSSSASECCRMSAHHRSPLGVTRTDLHTAVPCSVSLRVCFVPSPRCS